MPGNIQWSPGHVPQPGLSDKWKDVEGPGAEVWEMKDQSGDMFSKVGAVKVGAGHIHNNTTKQAKQRQRPMKLARITCVWVSFSGVNQPEMKSTVAVVCRPSQEGMKWSLVSLFGISCGSPLHRSLLLISIRLILCCHNKQGFSPNLPQGNVETPCEALVLRCHQMLQPTPGLGEVIQP